MVDAVIPIQKLKHFTGTLTIQHPIYCKLAAFEHFDQNSDAILCSILFPVSQVPDHYKLCETILALKVKTYFKLPNYYNLTMR